MGEIAITEAGVVDGGVEQDGLLKRAMREVGVLEGAALQVELVKAAILEMQSAEIDVMVEGGSQNGGESYTGCSGSHQGASGKVQVLDCALVATGTQEFREFDRFGKVLELLQQLVKVRLADAGFVGANARFKGLSQWGDD